MRQVKAALFAAASLTFAAACLSQERGAADAGMSGASETSMFRGAPHHPGVYAASGAPEFGGLRWLVRTQGPVRSTPTVAGGRIYFGSGDGSVYAVDLEGQRLWTADTGAAVSSSPAVAGGRVFVQNRNGFVLALSTDNGKILWRSQTGADVPFEWGFESGDMYVSSPTVVDGTVLVGSGDGHLYALEAESGKGKWRVQTGGRVRSSPAVSDGTVYVGSMDGSVYAADLATGALKWRFDTEGRSLSSARFGYDRKSIQSSPAVVDGLVYIGARDGSLYAVDAATGKQRWRSDHGGSWVLGAPAVWDGKVYAGSSDAKFLQAVDAKSGRELWRVTTPASVWSSPAVAGSTLYFADTSGVVYALDARTGRKLWDYQISPGVLSSPVPVEGAVLIAGSDGILYALGSGSIGAPGSNSAQRRAVFWDDSLEKSSWVGSKRIKDHLTGRGYEVVDADGVATLMEKAVADRSAARTVVTFVMDAVPPKLVAPQPGQGLFRRFLDAGGKVIWLGPPPLIWPRDPKTGVPGPYASINRKGAQELLGVDFATANFDPFGTRITPLGRAWGLKDWWIGQWAVAPVEGMEVLAFNENGQAAAWVKSFGGPPGTGFVMLGQGAADADPSVVRLAADHRPN